MSTKKNSRNKEKTKSSTIKDVYADNFIEEIKKLSSLLTLYNHVAMDTEFPGVVFPSNINSREAYYRSIKKNVDQLKLIQVGITISDEWGNRPAEVSTWQFNLKFDLNNDVYSPESIALLTNSGINFDMLQTRGISQDTFGEYIITSGLVLNEDIHWISFHGIYDFAYFLRIVTNLPIPETENGFFDSLKIYFNNYYDIRFLVRFNDNFRGSLNKLGQELNVARIGTQHQAGSDSLITSEIYFKLKNEYLSEESTRNDKNVLFGIGSGLEDSDSSAYTNGYYSNTYKTSSTNSNNLGAYDYNFYQQQNMMNMQYLMRNPNFFGMNNMQGSMGNIQNINLSNNLNFQNLPSFFPYNFNGGMPINYISQNLPTLSEDVKKRYSSVKGGED